MKKYIFLVGILTLISCENQSKKQVVDSVNYSNFIQFDSLIQLNQTDLQFKDSTLVWESLNDFHKRLSAFKDVNSIEDLRLLTEELIELEAAVEEVEKPSVFDTDAVNSRLILIRTYLFQLQAYIELDQELTQEINQIVEAYQSLVQKLELIENSINAPKLSKND